MAAETPSENATSSIRTRALIDFQRLSRTHRFTAFAAVIAAVGAGVGAIVPDDVSIGERFLAAVLLALAAPLLAYSAALLWSVLRAPFRQRRELVAFTTRSQSGPQPLLRMETAIEHRGFPPMNFGSSHHLSVGFVRVYNAQEEGGEAATAEHVSPEIKIFNSDDKLISHHKGWDINAWRDFTTSQEEHALWLVAKQRDKEGCFLIRQQDASAVQHLADGTYVAEITLRGFRPSVPTCKRFVFSSCGPDTDLTLEEESDSPARQDRARPRSDQ